MGSISIPVDGQRMSPQSRRRLPPTPPSSRGLGERTVAPHSSICDHIVRILGRYDNLGDFNDTDIEELNEELMEFNRIRDLYRVPEEILDKIVSELLKAHRAYFNDSFDNAPIVSIQNALRKVYHLKEPVPLHWGVDSLRARWHYKFPGLRERIDNSLRSQIPAQGHKRREFLYYLMTLNFFRIHTPKYIARLFLTTIPGRFLLGAVIGTPVTVQLLKTYVFNTAEDPSTTPIPIANQTP